MNIPKEAKFILVLAIILIAAIACTESQASPASVPTAVPLVVPLVVPTLSPTATPIPPTLPKVYDLLKPSSVVDEEALFNYFRQVTGRFYGFRF